MTSFSKIFSMFITISGLLAIPVVFLYGPHGVQFEWGRLIYQYTKGLYPFFVDSMYPIMISGGLLLALTMFASKTDKTTEIFDGVFSALIVYGLNKVVMIAFSSLNFMQLSTLKNFEIGAILGIVLLLTVKNLIQNKFIQSPTLILTIIMAMQSVYL